MVEGQTFTIGKCIVNLYEESEVIIANLSLTYGFTYYFVVCLEQLELLMSGHPTHNQ